MNKNTKTLLRYLLPTTVLGLAGMFLRRLMLTTAIDDKSLLIRFNLPSILLWIVTPASVCGCFWLCANSLTASAIGRCSPNRCFAACCPLLPV